jgi:rRNA-processing protein FCF1
VAQKLIKRFRVVTTPGRGDQSIINYAKKVQGIVVTNDKDLKKELRDTKLPVIYLRGNNHLELNGWCK